MTKNLLLAALIAMLGCQQPDTLPELLDHFAEHGRRKISSPFSGVVLVAQNDKVIFREAYGFRDWENKKKNTPTTLFPIGSITKQFTAMLAMQLVQESTLDLNASVTNYLTDYSGPNGGAMSIHHLLSHTSGLPHYEGIIGNGYTREVFSNSEFTPRELVALVSSVEPVFAPGERFYYSSLGYMLLGAIIEEVTGKDFATLLEQRITGPLGLQNTGFANDEFIANKVAAGHRFIEDETFMMLFRKFGGDIAPADFRTQSSKYATGGMHSTVDDLFIWSQAVREGALLDSIHHRLYLTPNTSGYCYGWFRNWDELLERNTEVQVYSHGGALFGHSASINLYDDGTTIIYLANVRPVKNPELTHRIYLAHDKGDDYRMTGYPDRSSFESFQSGGGELAFKNYFARLSDLCGYEVLPSDHSIASLMSLFYEEGLDTKADSLREVLLTTYTLSESSLNRLGYRLLDDQCERAVKLFRINTDRFPHSPNVWDSLGEGEMRCGQLEKALDAFTKAVSLAEANGDGRLEAFRTNLQNARAAVNP